MQTTGCGPKMEEGGERRGVHFLCPAGSWLLLPPSYLRGAGSLQLREWPRGQRELWVPPCRFGERLRGSGWQTPEK